MDAARHDLLRLARDFVLLALLLTAYHLGLRWLLLNTGLTLGDVGPGTKVYRLVPLYMHWRPHFNLWLLVAVAVLAAFLGWLDRVAWRRDIPTLRLAPILMLWHLAIAVSVAMVDGGPKELAQPFIELSKTDYIGGVPLLHSMGPRAFLQHYVHLLDKLPMHCQTHPPGAVLFLGAVDFGLPFPAWWAAGAVILASSLSIPAVYGLAKEVLAPRSALLATAMFMLAPNIVLFSATCMDAVFCVPMVWTFFLLWRARRGPAIPWGVLGGLAASLAALLKDS